MSNQIRTSVSIGIRQARGAMRKQPSHASAFWVHATIAAAERNALARLDTAAMAGDEHRARRLANVVLAYRREAAVAKCMVSVLAEEAVGPSMTTPEEYLARAQALREVPPMGYTTATAVMRSRDDLKAAQRAQKRKMDLLLFAHAAIRAWEAESRYDTASMNAWAGTGGEYAVNEARRKRDVAHADVRMHERSIGLS